MPMIQLLVNKQWDIYIYPTCYFRYIFTYFQYLCKYAKIFKSVCAVIFHLNLKLKKFRDITTVSLNHHILFHFFIILILLTYTNPNYTVHWVLIILIHVTFNQKKIKNISITLKVPLCPFKIKAPHSQATIVLNFPPI